MYALYARQSRDRKDSISIDSQFEFCMREVPEGTQIKEYKDKGFSGRNIERPAFQQLLSDVEKGKIEKIVVYRLDRISRSTLDFAGLINKFNKYNVDFISTTEKFDTSNPIGKAMLSIIMIFAELERETIQQRITDSYYHRGKKAMYLGGVAPYGFDLKDFRIDGLKTSILSPNEKIETIEKIYDLYANTDLSLGSIAKTFNQEEIKTSNDSGWSTAALRRTMKNGVYVKSDIDVYNHYKYEGCIIHNEIEDFNGNGLYVYGKGDKNQDLQGFNVAVAPHKGIVDSKIWLKCQYKLSKNKQIRNSGKSKYSWLSGLIKCGKCGYAMCVNKSNLSVKHGTFAIYFRCSKRVNKKMCDSLSVRTDILEEKVEKKLFEHIQNLDNRMKVEIKNKKAEDIKQLITSKETEIENLIDGLAQAKGAAMKYINKRLEKLDKEIIDLRDKLKKENIDDGIDGAVIVELKQLIPLWNELDLEEKKEIANKIIDKIYYHEGIVNIEWKL